MGGGAVLRRSARPHAPSVHSRMLGPLPRAIGPDGTQGERLSERAVSGGRDRCGTPATMVDAPAWTSSNQSGLLSRIPARDGTNHTGDAASSSLRCSVRCAAASIDPRAGHELPTSSAGKAVTVFCEMVALPRVHSCLVKRRIARTRESPARDARDTYTDGPRWRRPARHCALDREQFPSAHASASWTRHYGGTIMTLFDTTRRPGASTARLFLAIAFIFSSGWSAVESFGGIASPAQAPSPGFKKGRSRCPGRGSFSSRATVRIPGGTRSHQ